MNGARAELEAIFRAALRAVDPAAAVAQAVKRERGALRIAGVALPLGSRCGVIAAGKAAPVMAAGFRAGRGGARTAGPRRHQGRSRAAALARWSSARPGIRCRTHAASPPAARRSQFAAEAGADETLVVLLSGGASALLTAPLPGLGLAELRATTALLLESGADIGELNCVRKHLTAVSGGRLAAATRAARVLVLVISDVLGDELGTIGSGPCAPDPTHVRRRSRRARAPRAAGGGFAAPCARTSSRAPGALAPESPKPGDPALARVTTAVLASNRDALVAARADARARGLDARIVTDGMRGEARELGARFASLALATAPTGRAQLLLAGGEPTVTVRGPGRGGRAQELALAAALVLAEEPGVTLLAAGTDGSDGPTDAAGAFADAGTVARGAAAGLDARACLDANDAHGFFAREGGCLRTGPTGTNVMDLVLVRVERAA